MHESKSCLSSTGGAKENAVLVKLDWVKVYLEKVRDFLSGSLPKNQLKAGQPQPD